MKLKNNKTNSIQYAMSPHLTKNIYKISSVWRWDNKKKKCLRMYLLLKFRFSYANQIDYKVKLSLFDISHTINSTFYENELITHPFNTCKVL